MNFTEKVLLPLFEKLFHEELGIEKERERERERERARERETERETDPTGLGLTPRVFI